MWKPFKCRLFRDHDYDVRRAPDALFLQCKRCGKRSDGWNLGGGRVKRGDSPLRLMLADAEELFRSRPVNRNGNEAPPRTVVDVSEDRLRFSRL